MLANKVNRVIEPWISQYSLPIEINQGRGMTYKGYLDLRHEKHNPRNSSLVSLYATCIICSTNVIMTSATIIRVREHDCSARIEARPEERGLSFNEDILAEVTRKLKELGYEFVTLDVEGYKSGTFDHRLRSKQRIDKEDL